MVPEIELIQNGFQYLIDDYGFSIDRQEYFPEVMGNVVVVYKTNFLGIRIVIDRSQVLINIGNIKWQDKDWFELTDVISYFDPNVQNVYIFPTDSESYLAGIEFQVNRLALLLRKYCDPILRDDLTMQNQIREIEEKRVAEMLKQFKKLSQDYRQKKD